MAGALITPLISVDPNLCLPWPINSFMLVLVSGVSIPGLMVASLILGAPVVVSSYVSAILGGLTIVVLAAVILRIRPQGLFSD